MGKMTAVMQRELLSLFYSPIGYIVIAGFLLITGVIVLFTGTFEPGKPATLRSVFDFTPYVLTIIIPAICMRAISEEYRSGTIESLMTAPLADSDLVLGKYFAALLFYVMTAASLFALRRKRPDLPRPVRAPGYPWLPAIYIGLTAIVAINLLFTRTTYAGLGLLIVLLGVPVYFLWRKVARD